MTASEKVCLAAKALADKKGKKISAVKTSDLTTVCDYMIFAEATSNTHVRALSDNVEKVMTENGIEPHHIEGKATGWYLLDYTDVIVHVFTPDTYEFYNLNKIWSDGEEVDLSDCIEEKLGE